MPLETGIERRGIAPAQFGALQARTDQVLIERPVIILGESHAVGGVIVAAVVKGNQVTGIDDRILTTPVPKADAKPEGGAAVVVDPLDQAGESGGTGRLRPHSSRRVLRRDPALGKEGPVDFTDLVTLSRPPGEIPTDDRLPEWVAVERLPQVGGETRVEGHTAQLFADRSHGGGLRSGATPDIALVPRAISEAPEPITREVPERVPAPRAIALAPDDRQVVPVAPHEFVRQRDAIRGKIALLDQVQESEKQGRFVRLFPSGTLVPAQVEEPLPWLHERHSSPLTPLAPAMESRRELPEKRDRREMAPSADKGGGHANARHE